MHIFCKSMGYTSTLDLESEVDPSMTYALHNVTHSSVLKSIHTICTLGPENTNCELAARTWFDRMGKSGAILLYPTLEEAVVDVREQPGTALLGCVVYPDLHKIVFSNLDKLVLMDCFIMPTYKMVLASNTSSLHRDPSIATHPAPSGLAAQHTTDIRLVPSNAQAAIDCAAGFADACITTISAAERQGLHIMHDYGEIPMGFTIHAHTTTDYG